MVTWVYPIVGNSALDYIIYRRRYYEQSQNASRRRR
jgi:sensor domain CHASE-containing protein